jgi:hypothetical protein
MSRSREINRWHRKVQTILNNLEVMPMNKTKQKTKNKTMMSLKEKKKVAKILAMTRTTKTCHQPFNKP